LERLEDRLVPAAQTFTVTALTDLGPSTGQPAGVGNGNSGDLRYCMNQADQAANAGSTINFQVTGRIMLDKTTPLPSISENMTIEAPSSTNMVTVQGQANAANPYRIINIFADTTVEIDNLVIYGGYATVDKNNLPINGAGIMNRGNLTLTSSAKIRPPKASVEASATMAL
jgi:hypothetical protein